MTGILTLAAALLAFANGANDNFKGVATLWGTGRYQYRTVLAWATLWTFVGSLAAAVLARGLTRVFDGSRFLDGASGFGPAFFTAVALGAAATVLIATRIGAPVSTTHALAGALVGAGVLAAGPARVLWSTLAASIALPLLISPVLALLLTLIVSPPLARWLRARSCICMVEPAPILLGGGEGVGVVRLWPELRVAHQSDCKRGDELARWNTSEMVHWVSAGLVSFSRALNDTPKIAALVLAADLVPAPMAYLGIALAIAVGGLVGAKRVATTMAKRVTEIEPVAAMNANLVSALLVAGASRLGLPVSTTHVTMGSIFGVALERRQRANWRLVRQIVLAWAVTLPLGLVCGLAFYSAFKNFV